MAQSLTNMSPRAAISICLLIVLGFLGNYFALPLFFGADFLFEALVLLVLYFYEHAYVAVSSPLLLSTPIHVFSGATLTGLLFIFWKQCSLGFSSEAAQAPVAS